MSLLVIGGTCVGEAITDLILQSKYHTKVCDALLYKESSLKPLGLVYRDIGNEEMWK